MDNAAPRAISRRHAGVVNPRHVYAQFVIMVAACGRPVKRPDEVVARLQAYLLPHTTDLIVQVHPGLPTPAQFVRALERIAREVAPALGWQPATGQQRQVDTASA